MLDPLYNHYLEYMDFNILAKIKKNKNMVIQLMLDKIIGNINDTILIILDDLEQSYKQ